MGRTVVRSLALCPAADEQRPTERQHPNEVLDVRSTMERECQRLPEPLVELRIVFGVRGACKRRVQVKVDRRRAVAEAGNE